MLGFFSNKHCIHLLFISICFTQQRLSFDIFHTESTNTRHAHRAQYEHYRLHLAKTEQIGGKQTFKKGEKLRTAHHQTIDNLLGHTWINLGSEGICWGKDRDIEHASKKTDCAGHEEVADGKQKNCREVEHAEAAGKYSDSSQVLLSFVNVETHQEAANDTCEDKNHANYRDLSRGELWIEKRSQNIAKRDVPAPDNYEYGHVEDTVFVAQDCAKICAKGSLWHFLGL